jgi:hypothetical protein
MDNVGNAEAIAAANGGILSREGIIARPGFNRWLVPPAALAIHLCIGMAYGFSVFGCPCRRRLALRQAQKCRPARRVRQLSLKRPKARLPR